MFVLESSGSDPWTSDFTMKSMLNTYDQFATDGTYFLYKEKMYHIYSCWETAHSAWLANLCITQMSDPWTVSSNFSDRRVVSLVMRRKQGKRLVMTDKHLTTDFGTRSAMGLSPFRSS